MTCITDEFQKHCETPLQCTRWGILPGLCYACGWNIADAWHKCHQRGQAPDPQTVESYDAPTAGEERQEQQP